MDWRLNITGRFGGVSWLNSSLLMESFPLCPDSLSSTTFLLLAYSAIMAVGVVGNTCLVLVITRQKEMRNVTNVLIANLSCSDILVSLICLPVTVIYTMMDRWILGSLLCKLTPFVQCTSITVSVLSLVLIALERHQLIIHPTGWKPAVGHAYLAVVLSWLVGCFISLPLVSFNVLTSEPYTNISFLPDGVAGQVACVEHWSSEGQKLSYTTSLLVFQYGLPLLLMLTCYFRIFLRLRRRKEMVDRPRGDRHHKVSHSRRVNIMLASIVVAFGLCWMPLTVFNTVYDWDYEAISICHHNLIFSLCHLTAMLSTCVNPVIYGFLNANFQKEVKAMLYQCRCSGPTERYETFPLSTVNTELSKASLHLGCTNNNV
ncbi:neuropeptide Y receptor type 1-like [Amblyraja radiata]|uniref:neuropeptide Y receptor type 1-like n=1 Tax=Amblyraja radiata TaxID=386614 RepID=UPI001402FB7F|nr:neuropeptide Y receptor type 1-like [Amblyraja radiata]